MLWVSCNKMIIFIARIEKMLMKRWKDVSNLAMKNILLHLGEKYYFWENRHRNFSDLTFLMNVIFNLYKVHKLFLSSLIFEITDWIAFLELPFH